MQGETWAREAAWACVHGYNETEGRTDTQTIQTAAPTAPASYAQAAVPSWERREAPQAQRAASSGKSVETQGAVEPAARNFWLLWHPVQPTALEARAHDQERAVAHRQVELDASPLPRRLALDYERARRTQREGCDHRSITEAGVCVRVQAHGMPAVVVGVHQQSVERRAGAALRPPHEIPAPALQ
eukprot:CAMPEP_0175718848 /NCGR_PEP_ID=MMETSP0097-20121207/44379_1 /TAXON_ID=311494 /ORGANISM="Alexandrium monilatum, Strain CCMP3105" /LENGTH=185 /DNA_ID=CAMNT_0017026451 /DNA_START=140 /DNA_END=693 /DNA_ORIENTATION=+